MTCSHCYAETFNRVDELDMETWRRVTGELYEMGVFRCVIQGGEPTVARDRLEALVGMTRPDETSTCE